MARVMRMSDREDLLLDTALRVLAERGPRGLTHRAVDAAAGLPPGSTSNGFRTRRALVEGIASRLEQLDRQLYAGLPAATPADARQFADRIAALVAQLVGPEVAPLTRARMMFAFDDGVDLSPQHDALMDTLSGMLGELAISDPDGTARRLADYLDGLMLHTLTLPNRAFDQNETADTIVALVNGAPS